MRNDEIAKCSVDIDADGKPEAWNVAPIGDEREHDMSELCWCRPSIEHRDPVTGKPYADGATLVIHRDATQRAAEAS